MGTLPEYESFPNTLTIPTNRPSLELLATAEQAPKGRLDTYGATPLDHQLAAAQQWGLLDNLKPLVYTEIPEETPDHIAEYMKDTFEARFHKRGIANHENLLTALHPYEATGDDPELDALVERALMGHASPAEVLIARELLGIRSAELACLSHPYGKRIEYLDEMRDAVRESVEMLGGVYDEDPETRFRVKGTVGMVYDHVDEVSKGFFMTRKRTLGMMPDGTTIRERTSFVLRTEYNGVPFVDLAEIRRLDPQSPTWQEDAVRAGDLDTIAAELMEADAFNLAIPVSTTIYAFNYETADAISQRSKEEHDARVEELNRDMSIRYPALSAEMAKSRAKRAAKDALHKTTNIGDMYYVGPIENETRS